MHAASKQQIIPAVKTCFAAVHSTSITCASKTLILIKTHLRIIEKNQTPNSVRGIQLGIFVVFASLIAAIMQKISKITNNISLTIIKLTYFLEQKLQVSLM